MLKLMLKLIRAVSDRIKILSEFALFSFKLSRPNYHINKRNADNKLKMFF